MTKVKCHSDNEKFRIQKAELLSSVNDRVLEMMDELVPVLYFKATLLENKIPNL